MSDDLGTSSYPTDSGMDTCSLTTSFTGGYIFISLMCLHRILRQILRSEKEISLRGLIPVSQLMGHL